MTGPRPIRVATLNVRNTADRWKARAPLLAAQMAELHPDVIGLQELRRWPSQASSIARRVAAGSDGGDDGYGRHRAHKTGLWGLWEGIAVLSRLPIVGQESRRLGGEHRVAQRVTVRLPGGGRLDVYNVHLASAGEELRTTQARHLLGWMDERPTMPQVLLGDFNARPASPTIRAITEVLRSAHADAHGHEPPRTVPTPLRIGAAGGDSVIDFIFVNDGVEVHEAQLAFDRVSATDERLAASDHYGLVATVSARPPG